MIAILTSSLGNSRKADGRRYPLPIPEGNGLAGQIRKVWKEDSRVLLVSASPKEHERNDSILYCQRESFSMSGLSACEFLLCDGRSEELIRRLEEFDVLILAGGHVPTQNRFFERLELRRRLRSFEGLVLSWSAGSMNCAETVYAMPELEGEGADPAYRRFIPGLGITERQIIPHFQDIGQECVDGLRALEDMVYPDSIGREFIALCDGSYIVQDGDAETLYGEAYRIRDGRMTQICGQGESAQI